MKTRSIPGINIQTPWAELLVTGAKVIETRTYRMPKKYEGIEVAIIETPGADGKFKARIIGTIVFGASYEYTSRSKFVAERSKHLVDAKHEMFGWPSSGSKWAWPVLSVTRYKESFPAPKPRGIVFASTCKVPAISYAASSSINCTAPASTTRSSIEESIL